MRRRRRTATRGFARAVRPNRASPANARTQKKPRRVTMKRCGALVGGLSVALCVLSSGVWAAADPAMVKARQKFFGIDNVDVNTGAVKKDKVITSWATNTTYVTSILGRVILLDTFIQ